jgi:hypothetical protein
LHLGASLSLSLGQTEELRVGAGRDVIDPGVSELQKRLKGLARRDARDGLIDKLPGDYDLVSAAKEQGVQKRVI